jgi:hypothetical protein
VTIDGVRTVNGIYWILIQFVTTLYKSLSHNAHSHVFTSRCSVAAFNDRRSPYSGFPNYPRASATVSNSNNSQGHNCSSPLTNYSLTNQLHFTEPISLLVLLTASRRGSYRKQRSSVAVTTVGFAAIRADRAENTAFQPVHSRVLGICCPATGVFTE